MLELFIKYQIPSDLLSYGGDLSVDTATKIGEVKKHVRAMQEMIQASKDRDIKEKQEQNTFTFGTTAQALHAYPPPSNPFYAEQCNAPSGFSFGGAVGTSTGYGFGGTTSTSAGYGFGGESRGFGAATDSFGLSSPGLNPFSFSSGAPASPAQTLPVRGVNQPPSTVTVTLKPEPKKPVHKVIVDGQEEELEDEIEDYTKIPQAIETQFAKLDEDNRLRPTIINPGKIWTKKFQKDLLSETKEETLNDDKQETEKDKAFDLLDALSRSGCLAVDHASLHVLVAATHCFDKTLMATLIQDNQNPIEKVERSTLIVASTVHSTSPLELVSDEHLERVQKYSPILFGDAQALLGTSVFFCFC